MNVTRQGRTFDITDNDWTRKHNFWAEWFCGGWEAPTFAALDELADPARDYLDLGAWVGPTVLWAAGLFRRVVAVEPDPGALGALRKNVIRNCDNVTIMGGAVAATPGRTTIETAGAWGDSMSSLQHRADGAPTVAVDAFVLPELIESLDLALVKIDIEGGEGLVVPPNADLLRSLGCPILLSVHWPWLPPDQAEGICEFADTYGDVRILERHDNFPSLLLVP